MAQVQTAAEQALIFDVQRFSLHDGPGIRTTVFFKGCPLRCAWCQNPESLRTKTEIGFFADRCRGTGDCRAVCERGAIADGNGRIDRERCDACGACVPECPYGALQQVGRTVTVEGLFEEVCRDLPFFRATDGGITLSGGEPTLQMGFVSAFARRCREIDLGVGLQTCGAFKWEAVGGHLELFELIHFDLKVIDAGEHRRLAGSDNRRILDNARRLVDRGAPVLFRTPVIPGQTDSEDNLRGIAAFLREMDVSTIHLLRYHAMGEAKLPRLGFPIPPLALGADARRGDSLERAADLMRSEGLRVTT